MCGVEWVVYLVVALVVDCGIVCGMDWVVSLLALVGGCGIVTEWERVFFSFCVGIGG